MGRPATKRRARAWRRNEIERLNKYRTQVDRDGDEFLRLPARSKAVRYLSQAGDLRRRRDRSGARWLLRIAHQIGLECAIEEWIP